jgi:hypothetical protein
MDTAMRRAWTWEPWTEDPDGATEVRLIVRDDRWLRVAPTWAPPSRRAAVLVSQALRAPTLPADLVGADLRRSPG